MSRSDAAREGPVADDRHDFEILTANVPRRRHSESRRDRRRRVSRAEGVVFTLAAPQESGDAALLAQRLHLIAAAGEELMRISLVADVPHELIYGRVEHVMKRDGKLDDAKARADVAAGARAAVDQTLTDLRRELAELVARERF